MEKDNDPRQLEYNFGNGGFSIIPGQSDGMEIFR